jgi:hypothetical protein
MVHLSRQTTQTKTMMMTAQKNQIPHHMSSSAPALSMVVAVLIILVVEQMLWTVTAK